MTGCELNQIFLGEIAAVQNYGAFVRIPGCTQQGLIHKSQVCVFIDTTSGSDSISLITFPDFQVSSSRVDDVAEVLQRGERVWCKIISINDEGKISLSMKLVNQGNGTDLDPTGVQMQRDEQKRKSYVPGQRKVIELQAVLNTTCGKCGTHGHLSSDCFMSPDGKTYELLPEIEEEKGGEKVAEPAEVPKGKKHKSKKSKAKKKSKKSKDVDSTSDSDSDKKSERKRSKEKRKEKKKKKKSKEDSSESDSSDVDVQRNSLKRKNSDHRREGRTKKCKYSSSKR